MNNSYGIGFASFAVLLFLSMSVLAVGNVCAGTVSASSNEKLTAEWKNVNADRRESEPVKHYQESLSECSNYCGRIFEAEIRDRVIHGAVVMSGGVNGDVFSAAWGWADTAHTVPMTTKTVVDMASVTKVAAGVTAYLVAHAKGLVDFNLSFTNYLPEYSALLLHRVTVNDLANHRSGFGEADGPGKRVYYSDDVVKMIRNINVLPPAMPKKEYVAYSCRNYVLLGRMLEHIVGKGVDSFIEEEVFRPVGMSDSSLGTPVEGIANGRLSHSMGTERPGCISDYVARPLWDAGIGTLNAGMFSTAEDLARLMRTYLRGGVSDNGKRLFGAEEMKLIAPSTTVRIHGARSFGWQFADVNLP